MAIGYLPLPSEMKITSEIRKRVLQEAFRKDLPKELFNRKKKGFEVPLLQWFRTELRSTIEKDLLADDYIEDQGVFDRQEVQKLKKKLYSSSPGDVHAKIWALIVFQSWYRNYLKK